MKGFVDLTMAGKLLPSRIMSWDPAGGSLDFAALQSHYARDLSVTALIKTIRHRVENSRDPAVWISTRAWDDILARAASLDARRLEPGILKALPLFGLPFAAKDNIDVAGLFSTAACPAYAYKAEASAPAVARLEAAGALCIGKTNMDQFATGLVGTRSPYGAVANAFLPQYVSGGSSSGSAVAVALGHVSFALGTDTAGSGRIPAAFNNLVGLKPTRGLVSARDVVPACRSLDCVTVFALNVPDAFAAYRLMQAPDPDDAFSRDVPAERRLDALAPRAAPAPFRFAVPPPAALPGEPYRSLFAAARARLESQGGAAVETSFAPFEEAARLLYQGPWIEERQAAFGGFVEAHPDAVLPVIRQVLAAGSFTAADAYRAYYRLRELRAQAAALFRGVDCLLLPTAPEHPTRAQVDADPIGVNTRLGRYTNFANLLDLSALAVPAGFAAGLPFGITLMGPAFSEARLAALGARFHASQGLAMGTSRHPTPQPAFPAADPPLPRLAVAGLHLGGQPLNPQLTALGARLVRTARTAPAYTLHVIARGERVFPGLLRAADGRTAGSVELEVWEMTAPALGAFLENVREPLCIGTVEMEDGEKVKGFLCEAQAAIGARDITELGGWRAWLKAQAEAGAAAVAPGAPT